MLNLFYITNRPDVALIAEKYGVDRIWVDLEKDGKVERQGSKDTVISQHDISDIAVIKPLLTKAEMLVRINPWSAKSKKEIDDVIAAGADLIMLPMWKTPEEVGHFLEAVNGRTRTMLLLETKEAVECVDEVMKLDFDEIHIGLNDLHLSYGMDFLFQPLANGLVDTLCDTFREKGIPFGFGGIARLGKGNVPAEKIIMEHYRLGSTRAILSRSFCDVYKCDDVKEIESRFKKSLPPLREFERVCAQADEEILTENMYEVRRSIEKTAKEIKANGK